MKKSENEPKKTYKYGITDVPQPIEEDDILEVKKYVLGLENFIRNCPTPMSIALQGDWGTGKTTFLRTMESDFNECKDEIKTIYFNTWQYSQFNHADKLYESFLGNIMLQLEKDDKEFQEKAIGFLEKIWKVTSGVAKDVAMNYVDSTTKEITGVKLSEEIAKYNVKAQKEQAQIISDLKEDFTKMIAEYVKKILKKKDEKSDCDPRIVIFVDDLDRLNPARAVEMLEVLKLFMDVENCVYVLAIDYDVVVNGVRQKYGSSMTEDKCRSFFDKIIQLPFSMPVNAYRIGKLLATILPDAFKSYQKVVENYIGQTLGMNPRTLKRLANSYHLLEAVEKEAKGKGQKRTELQHTLLILTLTTQMYSDLAYDEIARCQTAEALKVKLGQSENEDEDAQEDEQPNESAEASVARRRADNALTYLGEAYEQMNAILEENDKEQEEQDLASHWIDEIHLSSITNVTSAERPRATAGLISAVVDEEQLNDENATNIYQFIVQKLLLKNMDRLAEVLEVQKKWITIDVERKGEGYFKRMNELEVKYQEQPVYLGIHTSNNAKRSLIKKLCKQLQIAPGKVKWIEDDNNLLTY